MHPDLVEIMTEARFEKGAGFWIKWLATAFQAVDLGFKIGCDSGCFTGISFGLQFLIFLLFRFGLLLD